VTRTVCALAVFRVTGPGPPRTVGLVTADTFETVCQCQVETVTLERAAGAPAWLGAAGKESLRVSAREARGVLQVAST
jgi:hypothetical protein